MRNIFESGRFILLMILITPFLLSGDVYYIDSTNGNDLNDGLSISTAWGTFAKANSTIKAGDTLYVREGVYTEYDNYHCVINPSNSGTPGNYITYARYENEEVIFTGCYQPIVLYSGKNYIKIDGFIIDGINQDQSDIEIFARIYSSYNIIQNCIMRYGKAVSGGWNSGIRLFSGSHHNKILNNIIHHIGCAQPPADADLGEGIFVVEGSHHNLIEGNEVYQSGHNCIAIDGDYNIIRDNDIHNENWGRCCALGRNGTRKYNVYENNKIRNSGGISGGYMFPNPGMQTNQAYGIIRRNKFYKNYGHGLAFEGYTEGGTSAYSRAYHNIFYDNGYGLNGEYSNYGYGMEVNEASPQPAFTDVMMKNNILYDNRNDGVWYKPPNTDPDDHSEVNNHKDSDGDPQFTDPANADFILQPDSPCIDAGAWLAYTNGSGDNSTTLIVNDAGYFSDGFGIVEGDLIQLEGQTQTARIISIDYDNNIITVDTALNWYSGQGVSLPYSGSAPDIGAYEYSSANPLNATINASPTSGQVPLTVSFTGNATGGSPPYTYSWNFRDGTSSSTQNPSHTYSAAGDYTAILTVTDSASNQDSESVTINAVNPPPLVASLIASPTSGQILLSVNFTGGATGGSPPYTYSWNFGDGASSSTQNPSHTYSAAGNYTVTLTVSDSASSQDSESVTINANTPHTVTTPNTPNGPSNGSPSLSYSYTTGGSSCSQGHSIEYRFDWGDGAYSAWSSSTIASHSWPVSGSYAVKAQARCSINHSIVSGWSSEKTVTLATSSYYNLAVSSATGSPTPGQGGTTDPSPGNHSYPNGNSVLVSAITNTDYRFSKWTGDVSSSDTYNEEITVSMDNNKSISAYFCTKCGDVNGDLNITPADAQEVFEIFLGIISDPTDCQKENADVNCDGTKTDPKITPGDAQAIFEKFLGINDLPGDCSCKSRAESAGILATQERAFVQLERSVNINLIINDIELKPGKIIAVPIIIDNPSNIKAFGFDILFESEILEFVGVVRTELLKDFNEVDGNEIAQGVLRVGGYSSKPIRSHSPGALIRLIFKVTGETEEPCPFLITNTVDDLENASFQNRTYMRKKIRRKDIVF